MLSFLFSSLPILPERSDDGESLSSATLSHLNAFLSRVLFLSLLCLDASPPLRLAGSSDLYDLIVAVDADEEEQEDTSRSRVREPSLDDLELESVSYLEEDELESNEL